MEFEIIKGILYKESRKTEEKDWQIFYYPRDIYSFVMMYRLVNKNWWYKWNSSRMITHTFGFRLRDDDYVSLYTWIKY